MSTVVQEVIRKLPDPHAIFTSFDTPYSKYCNTNYAAWEEDIPPIRKILFHQQQQIDDLHAIIKVTEDMLNELRKKRDQVLSLKKAHEGFISSGIRRLPSEILREVFVLCSPPEVHLKPETQAVPLLLTWVCRRWREIALDTPRLWCSLCIQPKGWVPEETLPFYDYCLSNARGRPLSLQVDLSQSYGWRNAVIELLQPYMSQCKELSVTFDEATGIDLLLKAVPLLKFLKLHGDMKTMGNAQTISIIQEQPRLRTLYLDSKTFRRGILSNFNPGLIHLTHLSVALDSGNVNDHIFFTLLRTCSNLEHFMFSSVRFSLDYPASFTHPKLRSLAIARFSTYGPMADTLLTFPNLYNLQIQPFDFRLKPFGDASYWEGIAMARMGHEMFKIVEAPQPRFCNIAVPGRITSHTLLTRFNLGWTTLTHLRVRVNHREYVFLMLVQHCPNLEHLDIRAITVGDSEDPSPFPPVITHPNLRWLSIGVVSDIDHRFLDMVTLPNLLCLSMDLCWRTVWDWHRDQFKVFLSRSSCPLETLLIRGVDEFKEEDRVELLTLIPTLKHLDMRLGQSL